MSEPVIACSLAAGDLPGRVAEWRQLLASVVTRVPIEGGVRLGLAAGVSASSVVDLAARELACCPFFRFGVLLSHEGVVLEVRAPPEAAGMVTELLAGGTAAECCGC